MKSVRIALAAALGAAALAACAGPTPTSPRAAPPDRAHRTQVESTAPTVQSQPLNPAPDTTTRTPGQTFGSGT